MTLETEVVVAFDKHFGIDRSVRLMTNGATLPKRFMLEGVDFCLLAMALRTRLVEPRHGQTASGLHDVHAVRVMALNAIHFAFNHRMVLWKIELGVGLEMAIKTSGRIFARIMNQAPPTADRNVPAAGPVARFTASQVAHVGAFVVESRVRAGRECAGNLDMTLQAGFVADKRGAFDLRGSDDSAVDTGTGTQE